MNNPVNGVDPDGYFFVITTLLAATLIGAIYYVASYTILTIATGQEWTFGGAARAGVTGGLSGLLGFVGVPKPVAAGVAETTVSMVV
ncbi:MAG: hypothetical protein FWC72_03230, partial [Oscillospiraceae bacterium]|nr:hypothetical protein [Oscillospiraceae bacterium]